MILKYIKKISLIQNPILTIFLSIVLFQIFSGDFPFFRGDNYDYHWHDYRNLGIAEFIKFNINNNEFSLFDYLSEFGYDQSYSQFNPLNPFNLFSFMSLGQWGIWVSSLIFRFFSAFSLYQIFQSFKVNKLATFVSIIFFITALSFQHYLKNIPTLISLLYIPIYSHFVLSIQKEKINYKYFLFVFLLTGLVCDIHLPLYIFFTFLPFFIYLIVSKRTIKTLKAITFFIAVHLFSWTGWIASYLFYAQELITDNVFSPSNSDIKHFQIYDLFSPGLYNIIEFFIKHRVYVEFLKPYTGSSLYLYVPLGAFLISAFHLKENLSKHPLIKNFLFLIFLLNLFNILGIWIVNSAFFTKLGLSFSYYRMPLNILPASMYLIIAIGFSIKKKNLLTMKDNNKRIFFIIMFLFDLFICRNDYIWIWLTCLYSFYFLQGLSKKFQFFYFFIFFVIYIFAQAFPLNTKYEFFSNKEYNDFIFYSNCINRISNFKFGERVFITGYSEDKNNIDRLVIDELAALSEYYRGSGVNMLFSYREIRRPELTSSYRKIGNFGYGTFPPTLNKTTLSFIESTGANTILVFNDNKKDFNSKYLSNFTHYGSCFSKDSTIDIYKPVHPNSSAAVINNKAIYPLEQINYNSWVLGAIEPKNILLRFVPYNHTSILVDGKLTKFQVNNDGFIEFLAKGDIITISYTNKYQMIMIFSALVIYIVLIAYLFFLLKDFYVKKS